MNSELSLFLICFLFGWIVYRTDCYVNAGTFPHLMRERFTPKSLIECAVVAVVLDLMRTGLSKTFPVLERNWLWYALPSLNNEKLDRVQAFWEACLRAPDGGTLTGLILVSPWLHLPYWLFLQEKAFRHRYLKLWQVLLGAVANGAYYCLLGTSFAQGLMTFATALFLAFKYRLALADELADSRVREPSPSRTTYRIALATSTGYAIALFLLTQVLIPSVRSGTLVFISD